MKFTESIELRENIILFWRKTEESFVSCYLIIGVNYKKQN